ncbi:uncharacterized protein F5147DRAFT_654939 [Suillus discolor]|uniref:Uncharacterized protein n=1 Tax=Suillus discolor TaxID=1912936 RepID=A0A9P7F1N0_9AGAM|nr:uncharacterized protein F5147DRAFT_654939 [Suillus discolor]KAG2102863.1 hypothetical protein F5147DRAFT_654939 [Suillus discolor]
MPPDCPAVNLKAAPPQWLHVTPPHRPTPHFKGFNRTRVSNASKSRLRSPSIYNDPSPLHNLSSLLFQQVLRTWCTQRHYAFDGHITTPYASHYTLIMSTSCLSPEVFDYSSACASIFELSNALGNEFLDTYIGFIASQKLWTELYVLSFLLKDHVYPGDLWELVGERSIEATQEEILRRHQSTCTSGDDERHATVEKKRCQMEVSLYSQAIELLEQHRMSCSITTRGMWEAWLTRNNTHLISVAESEIWFASQEERRASISSNCISPSLPLSSTWVTTYVQEAFYNAFQEELNMQAELMTMSLATRHNNTYLRNLGLDLLILQSKTHRAKAEIELYNVAIENAHGFDLCGSSSKTPLDTTIQRPLCKAVHCYNEDEEVDGSEGYEDYEDWKL